MHGGSCICTVRRVQDSLDQQRPTPLYACALPHGPQIHAVGCGRGQGNTNACAITSAVSSLRCSGEKRSNRVVVWNSWVLWPFPFD